MILPQSNRVGLSSACFYPEETLDAVRRCVSLGFKTIEIFMNSPSELEPPYLERIAEVCREGGVRVKSIHPFTSGFEYMLFFSAYKKRAGESIELYRPYFRAAAYLGADYVVFHGDKLTAPFFGMDNYCDVLSRLMAAARYEGVTLAHENVSTARGGNPEFMRELRAMLGAGRLAFVFDIKQVLRGGYDPLDMLDAMGGDIVHVHLNDWRDGECRLPFAGALDLESILSRIERDGFKGDYIIEVYRHNFDSDGEISVSKRRAEGYFLRGIRG